MDKELLLAYQRKLIYACLDDFSGISAMGGYAGGQDGPTPHLWWQASVDFLYRNLVCGLIEPNPAHVDFPIANSFELCQIFASNKPNEALFWFYIQFNATSTLSAIVQNHNLLDWTHINAPLALDFMEEIQRVYTSKEVSLSKVVLIPIHQ